MLSFFEPSKMASAGVCDWACAEISALPDSTPMVTIFWILLKTLYEFRANRLKRNVLGVSNCFLEFIYCFV